MKATIKGFPERWVLSPEWKSEGVMGDESGESIEPMEGVPFKRTGWVRIEKLVRVWRREARSWFQRQGEVKLNWLFVEITHVVGSKCFFTARCYACAVLAMGLCACLCLSQVVLLKRLNTGSQKQTTWSLRESSFFIPKISTKLDWSHPLRGRQMQAGWIKIGDFRKIAGYISKTVQDRRTVSIKVK